MSISLSTHVLDTERGRPASGVRVELWREDLVTASDTDTDGRIAPLATDLEPGVYRLLFRPPSPFFKGIGVEVELEDPLSSAAEVIAELNDDEKLDALNAHPAIGAKSLSARSAAEQGSEDDPDTLAELERLNAEYEQRFGFRFVVFVNRRPKSEIVPILRERLERTRDEELDTAVQEL